ncbi:hypothetical protein CNEONATC25_02108 [Clostridium neonatale]|uniref:Uncharacterized protein n=1 Tax=Clostridium neonatale TaxID=137838 RepID=A0A650LUD5_9CLOT|nr:hypothetical protein CNEONATC25_02108 [Clostridium neonatale]VCT84490.1 hypothetical protein CNEONATNEC25_02090 [Clostridium neonatale]
MLVLLLIFYEGYILNFYNQTIFIVWFVYLLRAVRYLIEFLILKTLYQYAYNDVKVTFHINSERALSKIDVNPKKNKHKRSKDKTKHMNVLTKH